jgi:3-hydroxymyristoyl/3-hydroxydecanoyl-(acyl carrier protein) dehydratase
LRAGAQTGAGILSAPLQPLMPSRRMLLRAVLAIAGAALVPARAQPAGAVLERSVKAAFIYKFLGYTEFPASAFSDPGAPVLIGVAGSEEMAAELTRIVVGRSINGRPVAVRQFREGEAPGMVHLLFVAGADCARVLRQVPPGPILLVTECSKGLQAGSIINFRVVEERVRFDVSLEAADKNNIRLSSRLLTVANHVSKGAP